MNATRARTRGQVMVLGCVALIITALMLMASFTVSNAIHEKIRIQSHSDATAYSFAVVEARAFNTMAYYNRAIAAALVAQMSIHSWMTIASADIQMLDAGMSIMGKIILFEIALGCIPPKKVDHCPCVKAAVESRSNLSDAHDQWANKLKGLEDQFNKGVEGLTKMVRSLHKGQIDALKKAKSEISFSGDVANDLKDKNANKSDYLTGIKKMSVAQFGCALEGTELDNDCDTGRAKASLAVRSQVIQSTANATRTPFHREGASASMVSHRNFNGPARAKVPQDALTDGTWMHRFTTKARVGEGLDAESDDSEQAKNVGAGVTSGRATVIGFKHSPPFSSSIESYVYSGQENGHTDDDVHQGTHDKFEHVMAQEPCNNQSCFVNFRISPDKDIDFGQPSVYAGVGQSLRLRANAEGTQFTEGAPWEVNKSGEITIKMDKTKDAKLKLIPRGEGKAVSKAKAYFHQMGTWKVAPNFFDPFWRAKLHFFKRDELKNALKAVGDDIGQKLITGDSPVEGEEK